MNYTMKLYEEKDYLRIRDFLKATQRDCPQMENWLIDRWNFCRYYVQVMLNTVHSWPDTVGIWEDESHNIVAVVNSEGENRGEAFFQLSNRAFSKDFLNELISFAERKLARKNGDEYVIQLRVHNDEVLKEILKARGYQAEEWKDPMTSLDLNNEFVTSLPEGFRLADGNSVSDYQKGFAHGRAFGYFKNNVPDDDTPERCFASARKAPDYRPELDLSVLDSNQEIASFACIWYDDLNKIGILEPVGTIPSYRRMGLARAVIYEGIRRIKALGAQKMYVGSDQELYLSIGFKVEYKKEIWTKRFSVLPS